MTEKVSSSKEICLKESKEGLKNNALALMTATISSVVFPIFWLVSAFIMMLFVIRMSNPNIYLNEIFTNINKDYLLNVAIGSLVISLPVAILETTGISTLTFLAFYKLEKKCFKKKNVKAKVVESLEGGGKKLEFVEVEKNKYLPTSVILTKEKIKNMKKKYKELKKIKKEKNCKSCLNVTSLLTIIAIAAIVQCVSALIIMNKAENLIMKILKMKMSNPKLVPSLFLIGGAGGVVVNMLVFNALYILGRILKNVCKIPDRIETKLGEFEEL